MPAAWTILAYFLTAAGITLALWSLFWDRSRGRSRCPKCWYDLSGQKKSQPDPPWTCPECGRAISKTKHLHRTRRRWRVLAPGLTLLIAAYPVSQIPLAQREGWRAAVPTWVIVTVWPLDIDAWLWHKATSPGTMEFELAARISPSKPDPAERLFLWRIERFAQSHNNANTDRPDPQESDRVIEIRNIMPICDAMFADDPIPTPSRGMYGMRSSKGAWSEGDFGDGPKFELASSLRGLLMWEVGLDQWVIFGGAKASNRWVGGSLVVVAPPSTSQQVLGMLDRLHSAASRRPESVSVGSELIFESSETQLRVYDFRSLLREVGRTTQATGRVPFESDVLQGITRQIQLAVDPSDWAGPGGMIGVARWLEPVAILVIRHKPEVHQRIQLYINDMIQRYREQGPEVLWADPPGTETDK